MIPDSMSNQLHGGVGSLGTLNAYYSNTTPSLVGCRLFREEGLVAEDLVNRGRDMGAVEKVQ